MDDSDDLASEILVAVMVQAICVGTSIQHDLCSISSSIPSSPLPCENSSADSRNKRHKHAVVSSREANKVFHEHE